MFMNYTVTTAYITEYVTFVLTLADGVTRYGTRWTQTPKLNDNVFISINNHFDNKYIQALSCKKLEYNIHRHTCIKGKKQCIIL